MDKDIISIETINGEKNIHFLGYAYFVGEPEDKPYRWVEIVGGVKTMHDFLSPNAEDIGLQFINDNKQYIREISEVEYDDIENINNVISSIQLTEITFDTPDGIYLVYEGDKK